MGAGPVVGLLHVAADAADGDEEVDPAMLAGELLEESLELGPGRRRLVVRRPLERRHLGLGARGPFAQEQDQVVAGRVVLLEEGAADLARAAGEDDRLAAGRPAPGDERPEEGERDEREEGEQAERRGDDRRDGAGDVLGQVAGRGDLAEGEIGEGRVVARQAAEERLVRPLLPPVLVGRRHRAREVRGRVGWRLLRLLETGGAADVRGASAADEATPKGRR